MLVFIHWFLPGDKAGGPVRSCVNLIDHLDTDFDFSVITRNTDYMDPQPYKSVRSDAWNTLDDGKRVYYISQGQLNRQTIARLLREEKHDAIYVNGIWSQPFTAWPLQESEGLDLERIVAVRGMLAPSALAIKAIKKKIYLAYAKLRGVFSDVTFHATTQQEAEDTRAAFGNDARVLVANNLPRKAPPGMQPRQRKPGALRVVNVARVAPEKNTLYAIEALAIVKAQVTLIFTALFTVRAIQRSVTLQHDYFPQTSKMAFHSAAAASSIVQLLSRHDLLFLPTRGENFGHVILEAMQAGVPVLIPDKTLWKNLSEHKAGWEPPLSQSTGFRRQDRGGPSDGAGGVSRMVGRCVEICRKVHEWRNVLERNEEALLSLTSAATARWRSHNQLLRFSADVCVRFLSPEINAALRLQAILSSTARAV